MSNRLDSAESLVADATGTTIAYECAARYPCFKGASRAVLKEIFERHGFPGAAASFDVTSEAAFGEAVSRYSSGIIRRHAKSGEVVVTKVNAEDGHVKAYLVETVERREGERQPVRTPGARIFLSGDDVYAAPPVDAPEIPVCAAVAHNLAGVATWLQTNADTVAVSRAMSAVYPEAGAMPWIARGSYVAPEGRPGTGRLVALITELRSTFYDPTTRCGLRLAAVPIKSGEEQSVQALVDAVLDEVSRDVDTLIKQCKDEGGRSNVRASTFTKRRDDCKALLSKIGEYEGLLGSFAERFRTAAEGLAGAYNGAIESSTLEVPDWAREYTSATSSEDGDDAIPGAPPVAEAPPAVEGGGPEGEASAADPEPKEDPFAL